ncbi:MAG: TIGR04552 family protein [Myxococcales bacterium]|nr:TIGR04552 family protein [Polyangiaceae bacterium]MDW8249981.1 TIGR04552 family protein [Myxococcales bacterium]
MAASKLRLKRLDELTLGDLEAIRLILRGDSIIDWHRLHFTTEQEAQQFLKTQEFRLEDPQDRGRLERIQAEAIGYLRRNFDFAIPKPIEQAKVEELLLLASGKGHRQVCACTVLKAMHIIHHLDARELLSTLPISSQELFQMVEEKVYRVIGAMLAAGLPITELIGGRKNKDSLYTKLLSKRETTAAAIYDKIRFRIVTRSVDDLLPVLQYLTCHLFAYNYVLPEQSINTIFHFRSFCASHPHLRQFLDKFQGRLDDELTPSDNSFSAESYRVMHFIVDMPIRLSPDVLERAPMAMRELGSIVFMMVEFQLVDRETEANNELGEASHARYKERQRLAVARRLKLGTREMKVPPSPSTRKAAAGR